MTNLNRALSLAVVFAGSLVSSVAAQDKSDFDANTLYRASCASCHGLTGMGDGPVAGALKAQLKPLTTLTKRHDGKFPKDYIYRIVDGREEVQAHGDRAMPVWGDYYGLRHQGAGADEATTVKIRSLVEHIKSMQTE